MPGASFSGRPSASCCHEADAQDWPGPASGRRWGAPLGKTSVDQRHRCMGGSVVEFSPATREARVRFPAHAARRPLLALQPQRRHGPGFLSPTLQAPGLHQPCSRPEDRPCPCPCPCPCSAPTHSDAHSLPLRLSHPGDQTPPCIGPRPLARPHALFAPFLFGTLTTRLESPTSLTAILPRTTTHPNPNRAWEGGGHAQPRPTSTLFATAPPSLPHSTHTPKILLFLHNQEQPSCHPYH